MARHFRLCCLLLFTTVMATPTDRGGNGYLPCTEGSCAHEVIPGGTRSRTLRSANQFVVLQMRGHRSPCTPAETKKAACLNGVCYSLSLAYMRSAFCECPEKYEGARCEQLSLDYYLIFMSSSSMVKGLIIGGVFFILLIIIIIISVCCHKWKKRKRQRLQEMKNHSEEAQPLSVVLPPPPLKEPRASRAVPEEYLTENGSTGVEMIELEHLNSTSNNISSRSEPQVS